MPQTSPAKPSLTQAPWFRPAAFGVGAVVVLALVVLAAKLLRGTQAVSDFIATYPGHAPLPDWAPEGLPAWLNVLHFLNLMFLVLIVRSGLQVRFTTRPQGYWKRNNKGLVKTKGQPKKISLDLWFHLCLDALWVLSGMVFFVLMFATGHWVRLVPTTWSIFPHALSAVIQYASLDWPLEDGWLNYNALQQLTYFLVVFIAAPLAIVTGLRMSGAWPTNQKAPRLNKAYPLEWARAVHFPVMAFFVLFVIVHVFLVLTTGALRNLNHMFASHDGDDWLGFILFAVGVLVVVGLWFLARPLFLRPVASLMGTVTRN
ncbi:cytochrome b/b6 domain-containing protein [Sinomonas sp. ASV486]|uniref:cytochrome b/b6 domain-containing protein n=1 Tax=Sinomonas sp. ASV486 TaxID=3051170 RepID=UPI0027DDCC01|nr:cytochrome b/b6 domain-containing protein [Sinomonas sp. ASV486]MDQ4488677.1 cytochrome b/b6 domain-containing protein [Sinomonas sp. ASV486]